VRPDATDEQRILQATTRRFLQDTVPLSALRRLAQDHPAGFDREWWRRGAQLGWTSLLVPERFGGGSVSGHGIEDLAIVAEEMGRGVAPGPILATNVVAGALAAASPTGPQRGVLDDLLAGHAVATWAAGRTGGSWLRGPHSIETRPHDGGFVLSGRAGVVEAGMDADWVLVTAGGTDGTTQFLLGAGTSGLVRTPLGSLDLLHRYAEISFDGVVVPLASVIGEPGGADGAVRDQLMVANVIQAAEMVGAASAVFEMTVRYSLERYSFGRPLASYQVLKHRMADMKLWLEACQATLSGACDAIASVSPRRGELVSVAASYVGDRTTQLVQDCIQIHGGIGVTWEHDLHLYLRRVTIHRQLFGTPADHRLQVAEEIGM
jgi:alkylation response protein AidB-like acyl-CoA dehydrogenase